MNIISFKNFNCNFCKPMKINFSQNKVALNAPLLRSLTSDSVNFTSNKNQYDPVGKEITTDWGSYKILDTNERTNSKLKYKIKILKVNPDNAFSLQRHAGRSEEYFIVSGVATTTCIPKTQSEDYKTPIKAYKTGLYTKDLKQGDKISIGKKDWHRVENKGTEPLTIIEVQTGNSVAETDIERVLDRNGKGGASIG